MRIKKTFQNDKPSGYPGDFPTMEISASPVVYTVPELLLQAKNLVLFFAKSLEHINPLTPPEQLQQPLGRDKGVQLAQLLTSNNIPFKAVSQLIYDLSEAGKLKLASADHHSYMLDVLASKCAAISPSYSTRDR